MDGKTLFLIILVSIFCGLGIIFLFVSYLIRHFSQKIKEKCTSVATATIVCINGYYGGKGHTSYHPVVRYMTSSGEDVTAEYKFGTNISKDAIGKSISIHYDPHDTKTFYIDDNKTGIIVAKIFILVGAGLIAIGLIVGILVWQFV